MTSSRVEIFKHESAAVDKFYELNEYERNIQLANISAQVIPIVIEAVESSLPAGVKLSIHEHDELAHEESRFIPDLQLKALKKRLEELSSSDIMKEEI